MMKTRLLQGAATLCIAMAGAAQAQTTAAAPSPSPVTKLPSVSVTADSYDPTTYVAPDASVGTKTDTPVMETPLNVQVVTQQVLRDQQAITLATALRNVSGVVVTDENYAETGGQSGGILVRGFIETTYYRDGFRVDNTIFGEDIYSTRQLSDIDSVEVLKGPGAVLYGLIEPGGIVNITTKQPQDKPAYSFEQQASSLGEYRSSFDATGPLNHDGSLAYRLDASFDDNGAPYGSIIDGTHSRNYFIAPTLKWNVNSSTWVKLEAEFSHNHSTQYFPFDPLLNNVFIDEPRNANYFGLSSWNQTSVLASVSWGHDIGSQWSIRQNFVFNGVYNNANFSALYEFSGPPYQFQNWQGQLSIPENTYSTETDLVGHFKTFGLENTLLFGGDFNALKEKDSGNIYGGYSVNFTYPLTGYAEIPCATLGFCGPWADSGTQNTLGLYLQDQVKLPLDLSLVAGGRFQYIHQNSLTGTTFQDLTAYGNALSKSKFTPRVGLLWHPEKWLSLYTNYAEGFGANNALVWQANSGGVLAPPSDAKSWEAGAKLEFYDGKLRISADYFNLIKTNVPTADLDPSHVCGGGGYGSCSVIIGEERSNGVEIDIQGEVVPGWSVSANFTHDPVRVTVAAQDLANGIYQYPGVGQPLPNVARDEANVWTTYEFKAGRLKGLKFGGGVHYTSSKVVWDYADWTTNQTNPIPPLPAWTTVDLMGAYSFTLNGKKVTAQLNITNLFNKTYYVAASDDGGPAAASVGVLQTGYRSFGAPFSAMGSLRVEF